MRNKVQILSIEKREIIIKKRKSKKPFVFMTLSLIICIVLFFASNNSLFVDIKESIIKAYNPVSSLYNDNGKIVFTNGEVSEKELTSLMLPIKSASCEILSDGTIEFLVGNSIMVTSCESGKVSDIGQTLNSIKYIEITHKNNVKTIVAGVEIIGVKEGDIVKSGQDIATARVGEKITLKIFQNDSQLNKITISKSKIIWEN